MSDWIVFMDGVGAWLAGLNPYQLSDGKIFVSPPWSLFVFASLSWADRAVAMLFPSLALLFVAYRLRKPWLIPIVGASLPFLMLTVYSNIDWLIMIGAVVGGRIGVIFDSIKPQVGLFVIAAEVGKRKTWRARFWLLLPLVLLALITFPLWRDWIDTVRAMPAVFWNFSLFPYTVPLGVVALYIAIKRGDALWGAAASLCIAPYWYVGSLVPLLCLVAARNWKLGILFSVATWLIYFPRVSG